MRNQITTLSLDLGASLGWSKCVCTLRPELHIHAVDHGTIGLDSLATDRMRKEHSDIYSRHRVRMIVYTEVLRKLIDLVKFDMFVVEDVFCNPARVNSFRSLVLYMEALENLVNVDKQKRLYTVQPTVIKKYISGYGSADKSLVQASVLGNPCISMKRPEQATEHEFDSIALCYTFIKAYLLTLG